MSLIVKRSYKGRFSTLVNGDTIKDSSLELLEACMADAVEAAVTGPDAAVDIEAVKNIVDLFGLDVDLMAGATGDGTEQPTL